MAVLFIVLVTPDVVSPRNVLEMTLFFFWISGFAYLFAGVPGLLTAGVDHGRFARKPLYLRLAATMIVAAIMAVLIARNAFGQRGEVLILSPRWVRFRLRCVRGCREGSGKQRRPVLLHLFPACGGESLPPT